MAHFCPIFIRHWQFLGLFVAFLPFFVCIQELFIVYLNNQFLGKFSVFMLLYFLPFSIILYAFNSFFSLICYLFGLLSTSRNHFFIFIGAFSSFSLSCFGPFYDSVWFFCVQIFKCCPILKNKIKKIKKSHLTAFYSLKTFSV